MAKVISRGQAVARSLDEQLAWEGGNPCYGQPGRGVGDYLLWVSRDLPELSLGAHTGRMGRPTAQRGNIVNERAQQQHAAALGTYSPIFQSPPVARPSSSAGKAGPLRGVACMISASSAVHPAGRSTCMPSKGLGAHGYLQAPGMRAAYVS